MAPIALNLALWRERMKSTDIRVRAQRRRRVNGVRRDGDTQL